MIVFALLGNVFLSIAQEENTRIDFRPNTISTPLGMPNFQNNMVSSFPYRMNLISPGKESRISALDLTKNKFLLKQSDKKYFGTLLRNDMPVTRHLIAVPLMFSKQISNDLTFFVTATPYAGSSLSNFGKTNAFYPQFDSPIGVSHFTRGINLSTGLEYKNWLFKVQYDLSSYDDKNNELPDIDKESLLFSIVYFF
jgi:hypothetical protein